MGYILAIDQGTTGTRVLVVDREGRIRGEGYARHTQYYPKPGWVEHVPEEIWRCVLKATESALAAADVGSEEIAAIGLDNQGETVVSWDVRTGEPLHPAIVWSCRRTSVEARRWADDADWEERVRSVTGLTIDPYFSATKVRWLLDHTDQPADTVRCTTLDAWLLYRLTGGRRYATDVSTASRTLLFDIVRLKYWQDTLDYLRIPPEVLAPVLPTVSHFGDTDPESFLGISAPVLVNIVDQPAALFGHLCTEYGMIKCTFGTGGFVLMNAGGRPHLPSGSVLTSIAWQQGGAVTYTLDGAIYSAGSSVDWVVRNLGLADSAAETDALARSVEDSAGVYYVPALTGLAAPHWDSTARGAFLGLNPKAGRAHLIRAMLEGIVHRVADVVEAMEAASGLSSRSSLRVDGGMVRNAFFMQCLADFLGTDVIVPRLTEATAMGVAYLVGLELGWWKDADALRDKQQIARLYTPALSQEQREQKREAWRRALAAVQVFPADED
ncbi:glycerol kinase GlpK [Kyrpidia sp.]|uniref:FGGY family carbohydrate kinase n=1 Tax=Kyrpidia sp. TaxID=2073077 RepID=UPI002584A58D|nr:glycerol kinase GlpK [Kyrpidia sp.]MCL6576140.1 glycerol kinase GlpK [Kyrpidia sp.]